VRFDIASPSTIRLTVFDLLGRVVRRLIVNQVYDTGRYKAEWKGMSDAGGVQPSGVYVCRLEATRLSDGSQFTASRKMLLVR
jgi:flagellar hook assembly protein FlgD